MDEKDAMLAVVTDSIWNIGVERVLIGAKAEGLASGDGVDVRESNGVSGVSVAAVAEGQAKGLTHGLMKGLAQGVGAGAVGGRMPRRSGSLS